MRDYQKNGNQFSNSNKFFYLKYIYIKHSLMKNTKLNTSVILLIALSYLSTFIVQAEGSLVLSAVRSLQLATHNQKRLLHGVNPLSLKSSLNTKAQNWANYLAANNLFQHSASVYPPIGQNLWMKWGSTTINNYNTASAAISWYSEIKYYNFALANPPNFSAVGHFTQMVWKSTTHMGVGRALSSDKKSLWIVVNYSPAGNYQNQYLANVLPLVNP